MIPTKPPPTFKEPDKWSTEFQDFVSKCLVKCPEDRVTATELVQVRRGVLGLGLPQALKSMSERLKNVAHSIAFLHFQ